MTGIYVLCIPIDKELKNFTWPKHMNCKPVIGEWVMSEEGTKANIYRITHVPEGGNTQLQLTLQKI